MKQTFKNSSAGMGEEENSPKFLVLLLKNMCLGDFFSAQFH